MPPSLKWPKKEEFPKDDDNKPDFAYVRDRIALREKDGTVVPLSTHLDSTQINNVLGFYDRMVRDKAATVTHWYTVSSPLISIIFRG